MGKIKKAVLKLKFKWPGDSPALLNLWKYSDGSYHAHTFSQHVTAEFICDREQFKDKAIQVLLSERKKRAKP